jgi:hypothetical protein
LIELAHVENDAPEFLALAQRIVNGAVVELRMREVFLVHIDNWFDHKWLGWWSRKGEELRVPTFTPNRVRSEHHCVWTEETSAWTELSLDRPLHLRQPGRPHLAQPLDRFSKRGAFIWYSGNSATNSIGCLMLYLSGADGYSWYASFGDRAGWKITDEFKITRRELLGFEKRGRQLELARA